MATATTTTAGDASTAVGPDRPPPLRLDSIPTIDLRLLSQSELYSLSLCSNSSSDINRCDDVVIPKIDRSVFNESAGSRKQTYSRLRLAPAESSSTSTKTTIHRRTPHLRSSHAPPSTNINDPEQAENSQIIRMLKELFKSDPNFEDLVPVEVENDINVVVPELLNPQVKRKRGRPRKHENAVFIRPPVSKRMRNNTVKKEAVFDNDRDREIVSSRGVTVNMASLAGLQDPYGPEIRRRTEGMSTKDELLGFLSGLNGQWVSIRKKKRIVDASDFGDALPKGWRLSLSIKKREGRVWLICRRYISPSGRQFESCKEVSTYLLSVVGERNHTHSNICDDSALKGASGHAADLVVQEDKKESSPVCNPSSPPTSLPTDCEKQADSDTGNPPDVQVRELLKCLKCYMIFEGKDDLLDHQVLTHKTERSQLGSPIFDWTVVKGGPFECHLCHKTFNERNQHNAHIGTHVENEIKTSEASQAPTAEKVYQSSAKAEGNVERCDACFDVKVNSRSPQSDYKISSSAESKTDELVHDLNVLAHVNQIGHFNMDGDILVEECVHKTVNNCTIDGNEGPQTDKASDVSVLGHEASMSINESSGKIETSDKTVDCVDDKLECNLEPGTSSGGRLFSCFSNEPMGDASAVGKDEISEDKSECVIGQGRSSGSRLVSPFSNELLDGGKDLTGKSASVKVLNHAVSEARVLTSTNIHEGKDYHMCSTFDDLMSGKEKGVNNESSSGVFHNCVGFDDDCVAEVKKLSDSESHSLVSPSSTAFSAVNDANLISSKKLESPRKVGFAASVDQVARGVDVNRLSFQSYNVSNMKEMTTFEKEDTFKSRTSVSWHGNERAKVAVSTMEEPRTQLNTKNFHIENGPSNKSGEANLDGFQIFRNNESIASIGSGHNGLNVGVTAFNTGKNLEFSSLVPVGNEQAFGFQDDITGLYDSAMEECKEESSERGLLNHFCISETSDDIFRNKIYSTPLDGLKFDEDRDMGMHELSLAFGNPHGLYTDTINVAQKKDDVNCSVVPSKIDDTFDVQTNLSMVNNSMVEDLKGGRESVGGLFSLSCNNETSGFQNNGNEVYSSRAWEGLGSGSKSFMMGSGSNQRHSNEVAASGMWKTSEGNRLQSGSTNPTLAQMQSPSCFHSFDIMSNKAEDGLFRIDERYNDGSGRSEPMEFSFLTGKSGHNPHGLQGDSYNRAMDQAFDSSFWMGKNAMMPNMGGRNMVTSVCAWCRNEFHLQAIHPETQAGMGSLCPACSAGISGQINML